MTFDFLRNRTPYMGGISDEVRAEAWQISIAQAPTLGAVGALEDRLHRLIARARDKDAPIEIYRDALALCAERRAEIAASAAMGTAGGPNATHGG